MKDWHVLLDADIHLLRYLMYQKSLVLQTWNLLCMIIKSIIMGLLEEVKESIECHREQKVWYKNCNSILPDSACLHLISSWTEIFGSLNNLWNCWKKEKQNICSSYNTQCHNQRTLKLQIAIQTIYILKNSFPVPTISYLPLSRRLPRSYWTIYITSKIFSSRNHCICILVANNMFYISALMTFDALGTLIYNFQCPWKFNVRTNPYSQNFYKTYNHKKID